MKGKLWNEYRNGGNQHRLDPRLSSGCRYTDEEVRQLVAALEEPFNPQEIKWRDTNTTKD